MTLRLSFLAVMLMSLTAWAGLPPGRPLPEVPINSANGKSKIDLKRFRGRALIVAVVTADCKECEETAALLKKIKEDNAAQLLQVMAVVVQPDAAGKVAGFITKNKPNFEVGYLDELPPYRKLVNLDNKAGARVPVLLFVDPNGMVRVQLFGDDPLMKKPEPIVRSTVRELLKEHAKK